MAYAFIPVLYLTIFNGVLRCVESSSRISLRPFLPLEVNRTPSEEHFPTLTPLLSPPLKSLSITSHLSPLTFLKPQSAIYRMRETDIDAPDSSPNGLVLLVWARSCTY